MDQLLTRAEEIETESPLNINRLRIGSSPSRRLVSHAPMTPLWKDYPFVPNYQSLDLRPPNGSQAGSTSNRELAFHRPAYTHFPSSAQHELNYKSSSVASIFGAPERRNGVISPPRLEFGPVFPPSGYRRGTYDQVYNAQRASDPCHFFVNPISRSSSQSSGFVESQQSVTPPPAQIPMSPYLTPYSSPPSIYSEPFGSASLRSIEAHRPTSYPSATWRPTTNSPAGIFGSVKPRKPRNLVMSSKTFARFGSRVSLTDDEFTDDDSESYMTSLTSLSQSPSTQTVPDSIRYRKLRPMVSPPAPVIENHAATSTRTGFDLNWKVISILSLFVNILFFILYFNVDFDMTRVDAILDKLVQWGQYFQEWFNLNHNSTFGLDGFQDWVFLNYTGDDLFG